uniref:Lysosomal dipeptide transporter MFSD1 n=1 Tax=Kryptolebias marmoratus TaxID=37003 RepID=A0A3Q3BN16_KRYMA
MADFGERRNLLGDEDEDEDSFADRQAARGPGRLMAAICDPSRLLHRVVVLFFMCFLGFGERHPGDTSGLTEDLNLNTETFMQLYAWYSWPNVVLCFFGGFLLDRVFGIRMGTIIFSLFVCVGQVIFAAGALVNRFWLMEAGRFVFGIGGESLAVAQNTYAVNWFKGKELNLVFGLQLSMARLGSTVNMNIMGWVYNQVALAVGSSGHTALGGSLMIAAATCVFSLICALVLAFLDKRAEKILNKEQGKTGEVIKLTDVKDFPSTLWLIFIICVGYYVAIFPFIGLGQIFFIEKFNFSPTQARAVNSIVYIISAPASPVLGFLVDKTGRNVVWVMIAVIATLAAHIMLAFTFWNPWIAMPMACKHLSFFSIQNLGLAVISITAGAILDSRGYLVLEVFFCACICSQYLLSAPVCLFNILVLLDTFEGHLNRSAAARAKLLKESTTDAE